MTQTVRVAIACQGGGAQTAFTAGVLDALLDPHERLKIRDRHGVDFEVVGLSGTSGGAVCAALTWADLLLGRRGTLQSFWTRGYPEGNAAAPWDEALVTSLKGLLEPGQLPFLPLLDSLRGQLLQRLLRDVNIDALMPVNLTPELKAYYAQSVFATLDGLLAMGPARIGAEATRDLVRSVMARLEDLGPAGRNVSALVDNVISAWPGFPDSPTRREFDVQEAFLTLLELYLSSDEREALSARMAELRREGQPVPELLIGAADVRQVHEEEEDLDEQDLEDVFILNEDARKARETNFMVFRGTDPATLEKLPRVLAASAAIPTVMRAVEIEGAAYWDALYSSNPPLYELAFLHGHKRTSESPACRLNPEELWLIRINPTTRDALPTSFHEIEDRRNELAGNLSMTHELRLVRKIDALTTRAAGLKPHHRIAFGFIDMAAEVSRGLDYPSKLDRRRERIEELYRHGFHQGAAFLARWGEAEREWCQKHPEDGIGSESRHGQT